MNSEIIRPGEPSEAYPAEIVGGKARGLLRLAELSRGRDFDVPDFVVIPVGYDCPEPELQDIFDSLRKPLAVCSSSPLEDSPGYSFAGRFDTKLGVGDFASFRNAVRQVIRSAAGERVRLYNLQHGLPLDDRMAVIVQEMINPWYSGVCYSSHNPENPKNFIEYTDGLSDQMLSGDRQGSIVSFDGNLRMADEFAYYKVPELERVAKVARELESIYGRMMDIEFAVSRDRRIHIVQARPVTDPVWPYVRLPEVEKSDIVLNADIIRGAGSFTGPVFVFVSPTGMEGFAKARNIDVSFLRSDQWIRLKEFNSGNSGGFCLITDTLEAHTILMSQDALSHMQALVTVNYASRFSHPMSVISETGVFYLGAVGRLDVLDRIHTGDTVSVVSDQTCGLVYNLVQPVAEWRRIDMQRFPAVPFETAIHMHHPAYEEVDDRIFFGPDGNTGIRIWDYNEEDGVPAEVYYDIVLRDGTVLQSGVYDADKALQPFNDFPLLFADLLKRAKR